MFGYIVVNKPELKFREFGVYQSYYCGLCRALKEKYGRFGQMTLSYDMTFLAMLLTGLYEPETSESTVRCITHPFEKHPVCMNVFTEYAADVNVLLSYYKCEDDWLDEHKAGKYLFASLLRKKNHRIAKEYPAKACKMAENLSRLHEVEKNGGVTLDETAGLFGEIMAELFVYKEDEWADSLRRIGFFFGKFIYLMDAYDDIEADIKKKCYNPFAPRFKEEGFEEEVKLVLTMMMAECSREFEKLPILLHAEILRNILYAGVWTKYEAVHARRMKEKEKAAENAEAARGAENGEPATDMRNKEAVTGVSDAASLTGTKDAGRKEENTERQDGVPKL